MTDISRHGAGTLELSGLTVARRGRVVLSELSARVPAGRVTGVIGPNGAGKSSLLAALAGVLPHRGLARLGGVPLPPVGTRERARRIAYLPQSAEVAWPLSVRRVVELGRLPHLGPWQHPGPGSADAAVVERVMAETDTLRLAERRVSSLSGGERARVLLARVLATEADVLLADEPVAALDPAYQLAVMDCLADEARQRGRTVLIVLHDLALAARYCDQLLLLAAGVGVLHAQTATVLDSPQLDAAYGVHFERGQVGGAAVLVAGRPARA